MADPILDGTGSPVPSFSSRDSEKMKDYEQDAKRLRNGALDANGMRALRLRAKKQLYSAKRNSRNMNPNIKETFAKRRVILNARPPTASKKIKDERDNFVKFLNTLNSGDLSILGYFPGSNLWENWDYQQARGGGKRPFTVNANGHLQGGKTVLMKRDTSGTLGLVPMSLKGEPSSRLLSAVGKYFDPTLVPHVRLVKFVANSVFRKGHRPTGRMGGLSDNQAGVY